MDIRFIEVPKVENDVQFELMAHDLLKANNEIINENLHGRLGQKQDGVDVFGRKTSNSTWIGIQCKVRSTNKTFSMRELRKEVDEALNFNPSLSEYYLYTTLSRDAKTQKYVREINDELSKGGEFTFEVLFWEDISILLKNEINSSVYHRHYHKFFADNRVIGHSIGKLVNLELQFDKVPDTHLELIIGRIPPFGTDPYRVNYYRGTYYIVNLHDLSLEFFHKNKDGSVRCFVSDIAAAFENEIDRYRVCRWLNQIENIDDFIYSDTYDYKFSISDDERWQYFKDREEE